MTFEKYSVRARLYFGFALILAILAAVTLYGVTQVHSIDNALRANNDRHVAVQRHAINFRGSAHDRSIAIRDVVLAASPADRRKEVETIDRLAKFYADSAGPLETMIGAPDAGPELPRLYLPGQARTAIVVFSMLLPASIGASRSARARRAAAP